MSDLISRSVLIEYINSCDFSKRFIQSKESIQEILRTIINEQSTAYDTDKVVAEIKSEVERWRESGIECHDKHDMAVSEGFKLALEIVKRGAT